MTIQTRLFANEFPKRPAYATESVRRRAAEMLLPDVQEWLGDASDSEAVLRDQTCALEYGEADGFELAEKLKRAHWDGVDAFLVEILDDASFRLHEAHAEQVKEWVRAHDLQLALQIGDPVLAKVRAATYKGEISRLLPDTAQYSVFIPVLGHVRHGIGTNGLILGFEDVTKLDEVPK